MSHVLCFDPLAPFFDRSFSDEARALRSRITADSGTPSLASAERKRNALKALQSALSDPEGADADGGRASVGAFTYAVRLLDHLPSTVPLPEIAVDADGDIAFEWDQGPRRLFSLRVSRDGTIYYAGLDHYATFHGSEEFCEGVPNAISEGISRIVSGPRLRAAS
jgi:hypothetical protein